MKLHNFIYYIATALLAVQLTACRSTQGAAGGNDAGSDAPAAGAYIKKVRTNAQTAATVTARVKLELKVDGRDLSASGNLRMKRDDVVQLSVTFLGIEVGRLEFSPDGVLIIDRANKQYVRADYRQVDFLRRAGLDFYAVQALFWNELFVPGERQVSQAALARFRTATSGSHTLLSLTDAPALDYEFLTLTESGAIDRLTVREKGKAGDAPLSWQYGDFGTLAGKPFPTRMSLSVNAAGRQGGLTLSLSKLANAAGWEAHTTPSAKYKERDANALFRQLMGL